MSTMAVAYAIFDPNTLFGLLGPLLLITAVALSAWAYGRIRISEAQGAAIQAWRQNYEAEKEKADIWEEKYHEQRELKHQALNDLSAEKMKTDQTLVLEELARFHQEFGNREALFREILTELATSRQESLDAIISAERLSVTEIAGELKQMEERLVGALTKQTEALDLIAAKLAPSE